MRTRVAHQDSIHAFLQTPSVSLLVPETQGVFSRHADHGAHRLARPDEHLGEAPELLHGLANARRLRSRDVDLYDFRTQIELIAVRRLCAMDPAPDLSGLCAFWRVPRKLRVTDGKTVARANLADQTGRTVLEQFFGAYLKAESRGAPKIVAASKNETAALKLMAPDSTFETFALTSKSPPAASKVRRPTAPDPPRG